MRRIAVSGVLANVPRLIATAVAVMLSVGFLVATLILSATFTRTMEQSLTASMAKADVWLTVTDGASSDTRRDLMLDRLPTVRSAKHVAAADAERSTSAELRFGGIRSGAQVSGLLDDAVRWQTLAAGRWPASDTEATLDSETASSIGLGVGDALSLASPGSSAVPVRVTIVGTTSAGNAGKAIQTASLIMTQHAISGAPFEAFSTGILVAGDGSSDQAVAASIKTALKGSPGWLVLTQSEAIQHQIQQLSGSGTVMTAALLGFGVIALFVAGLVIANTFQVLVAQRTKELAMLRCIGAGMGQVYRLILGEALLVGAVASALGVLTGLVGAQLLVTLSGSATSSVHLGQLVISPGSLVAGFAIGVLLTLASALSPARRATRVHPIEALRPSETDAIGGRTGLVRAGFAVLLIATGAAGLIGGARQSGLGVAMPAGVIGFVGVLLASSFVIPWAVRVAGMTVAWASAPARVASQNATRNPKRTTATAAALLVGVTLVTMMVVGSTSARASVTAEVDNKRPIDMTVVTTDPRGLTTERIRTITRVSGVDAAANVYGGHLSVATDGKLLRLAARGLDPDQTQRIAHSAITVPQPGQILLHPDDAAGIRSGQRVSVTGSDTTLSLVAEVTDHVQAGHTTVTAADLRALESKLIVSEILLRLSAGASGTQIQGISTNILSLDDKLTVGGSGPERAMYAQILDTLLLVVLALLAIAVVIAVVGVGNTMALSVIERRRESALLRALGLTTRQLRGMLAIEATLIAAVAALLGIGLGVLYGWAGIEAIGTQASKLPMTLSLPWGNLAAIFAVAVIAGLLASVIPGIRAARLSPVEALASD